MGPSFPVGGRTYGGGLSEPFRLSCCLHKLPASRYAALAVPVAVFRPSLRRAPRAEPDGLVGGSVGTQEDDPTWGVVPLC